MASSRSEKISAVGERVTELTDKIFTLVSDKLKHGCGFLDESWLPVLLDETIEEIEYLHGCIGVLLEGYDKNCFGEAENLQSFSSLLVVEERFKKLMGAFINAYGVYLTSFIYNNIKDANKKEKFERLFVEVDKIIQNCYENLYKIIVGLKKKNIILKYDRDFIENYLVARMIYTRFALGDNEYAKSLLTMIRSDLIPGLTYANEARFRSILDAGVEEEKVDFETPSFSFGEEQLRSDFDEAINDITQGMLGYSNGIWSTYFTDGKPNEEAGKCASTS